MRWLRLRRWRWRIRWGYTGRADEEVGCELQKDCGYAAVVMDGSC